MSAYDLSPWRVEWLRLLRTKRLLALAGVFALFGFTGPLVARYSAELLDRAARSDGQRIRIEMPPPVPADGITQYTGNALTIGLIVAVVVAAYACTVDSGPALSVFYRTRAPRFGTLLVPRLVVSAVGVVAAYAVGLLCAWYETAVLIGDPGAAAMARTALVGSVYLVFAVAVTAAAATLARGTLGTVGYVLLVLFTLPLLGALPGTSRWLPSDLTSAPARILRDTGADQPVRALAVACLLSVVLAVLAVLHGGRRELR